MPETQKSAWGRMRSGGGARKLVVLSLGGSLAAAVGLAAAVAAAGPSERFLATLLVFGFSFWMPFGALLWLLLVDRDTLTGAPKNVEDSVEFRWSERAAAGVFRDLLLALGVGAAVLSILQITTGLAFQWPLSLVLAGVLILAMADFGIRFQLAKRAES